MSGALVWQAKDQSGNSEAATRRNADVEGLTDRIDLVTGDMQALPFDDASFDLVVSNLAVHNIPGADDRRTAVTEALRRVAASLFPDWSFACHTSRPMAWPVVSRRATVSSTAPRPQPRSSTCSAPVRSSASTSRAQTTNLPRSVAYR